MVELRTIAKTLGVVLGLGALVGSTGCKPKRTRVPAICDFDVASDEEVQAQTLAPMTWLTLASPTVNSSTMTRDGELVSACGQSHEPLAGRFQCPGFDVAVPRVAGDRVEATDLIIDPLGEGPRLAVGRDRRAGQRPGRGGRRDGAVGRRRPRDPRRRRAARLSAGCTDAAAHHRGDPGARARERSLRSPRAMRSDRARWCRSSTAACSSCPCGRRSTAVRAEPQFELVRRTERPIEGGWVRRFVMTRSIELVDGGIVLSDLVVAEDRDLARPDIPPRPYMRVVAERPLSVDGDRLVLAGEDLWSRVLRDDGRVKEEGR